MKHLFQTVTLILVFAGLILCSCKRERLNRPPAAEAGPDQSISLPTNSIFLDGSASNDPDGNITAWQWSKVSGPSTFSIPNTDITKTQVNNLAAGTYLFELKVTDAGGLSDRDTMQVIVDDPNINQPPVANAGADTTITLPANIAMLDGSSSVDPDNNITSYQWTKISGPSSFTISNANAAQTQVANLVEGSYGFELKVTDAGGLTGIDTVQVMVQAFIDESGIYAAGNNYDVVSSISFPFYWHNGTRTNLSTGGYAESIFVSGTDVYVAGTLNGKPGYWKNGLRTDLPISSSSLEGYAKCIYVSGTDIYVAGSTSNPSAFPGYSYPYTPCYWKNGLRTDLTPILGTTSSIFVSGSDLYIAGDSLALAPGYHAPGYWKNGQRINLSNGGDATSIFVSGTDVYVAGYQDSKPCYWKNGTRTDLLGSVGYPAMSIFVSGGDVYVVGTSYNTSSNTQVACYWKNDVRTDLSYSSDGGYATSIFVSATNVYVAGASYNVSSLTDTPCYWKNGQRRDISGNGYLTSIFVKQ